jgi:putative transposase
MHTNTELPDRQTPRMKDYDYSDPGYYCITICIKNRRKMLGKIADGKMYPNRVGQAIQHVWGTLPQRFAHVQLDEFMLMPNHIHCIVVLVEPPPLSVDNAVLARVPQRFHARILAQLTKKRYPPLGEVIRTLKAVATYDIHKMGVSAFAWQTRYYESVLRTEEELTIARQYILANPERWMNDPFHEV